MIPPPFSPKQVEFIQNSTSKFNIAHGAVRTGKTVGTLFAFMKAAWDCPGSSIWMIGHTLDTIYDNVVRLLFEDKVLGVFGPMCTWYPGKHDLVFAGKKIACLGAKDERAIGAIQGKTFDLCYCDEMTLFPESIIQMIITRLSMPHSKLFAAMNPVQPAHIVKEQLIDRAIAGDKKYYQLHWNIDDNPFLTEEYKETLRQTLTGLFYKRNYLGIWCLAEGAIFDFFDRDIHVVRRPPRAAEFWFAGVDYGSSNPFAIVMMGYNSGRNTGEGAHVWAEKEYYWDPKKTNRQKTNGEFVKDMQAFFDGYAVKNIYVDPSAAALKEEMRRAGFHPEDADNDVLNGIITVCNLLNEGALSICAQCTNLIREIEGYVWDPKASKLGYDEPLKINDHACVTGDTKILTQDGYKSILYLENRDLQVDLINYDTASKKACFDRGLHVSLTRKDAQIYEIELEDGKMLRATSDHKIMTARGMVELQALTLSDMVLACNTNSTMKESSTKI